MNSIIRTVATDDLLTETDTDRSTIGNRNRNCNALQNRSTTTSTNQKRMYKSNAPTGRKTPSIVNVPTNECMNYNINDELTVDGNSNAQESVNTIQDLKDIIKHFGLSKYTSTNIPSRQDREYENNLDETDKRKYTQMVNISTGCINQVLKSICPGPSRRQLQRDISSRLSKNVGETADERKYRILFENMMEKMYCIMMNAKKGSTEKRVLKAILSKTMKKSIVQSYCTKFGCGDITRGRTKLQSNEDYDNLLHGYAIDRSRKTRSTHVTEQMIKDAVSFILHKDHVVTISWGDKNFRLGSDESITLPRLCRKVPHKHLWESYKASLQSKRDGLARSSIYYLIRNLTVSNKDIVTSVDYVQSLLVAEPVKVL